MTMTMATLYLDRLDAVIFDVNGARDVLAFSGIDLPEDMVLLARDLQRRYVPTAVVSSSRNCAQVLRAARVDQLFDVRVDGNDLDRLGLPGKPDPAPYTEAARQLGARPSTCAVVEDAIAGVRAGHAGGFGVVIGVDRCGERCGEMYEAGATVVVGSLADVRLVDRTPPRRVSARRFSRAPLPS